MVDRTLIVQFLKGKSPKRTYIFYLLGLLGFFTISLLISVLIFPEPFSFREIWISSLGDPTKNYLIGYLIFDVGFILASLGLIPVFINFYYRLETFHSILRWILLGLWIIGTLSFGSIGILHDKIQPIHDIFSGIAFASLSFAFLLLWMVYIINAIIRKSSSSLLGISLSIGQLALFWILLFAIPVRNHIDFGDFAPWEWVGTFSIIFSIFLVSLFLPKLALNDSI